MDTINEALQSLQQRLKNTHGLIYDIPIQTVEETAEQMNNKLQLYTIKKQQLQQLNIEREIKLVNEYNSLGNFSTIQQFIQIMEIPKKDVTITVKQIMQYIFLQLTNRFIAQLKTLYEVRDFVDLLKKAVNGNGVKSTEPAELLRQNQKLRQQVQRMSSELEKLKSQLEKTKADEQTMRSKMRQLESTNRAINNEKEALRAQMEKLNSTMKEINKSQMHSQSFKHQFDKSKAESTKLQSELYDLKSQLQKQSQNLSELQRVMGLVSKERDSLKGQLEKAKKQVDQLKKSNDTLALQLKRAEQQKLEIGQKEKGSINQNSQMRIQIQNLKNRIDSVSKQRDSLKEELDKVKADEQTMRFRMRQLESTNRTINSEKEPLGAEVERLNKKVRQQSNQAQNLKEQLEKSKEERSKLQSELADLRQQLQKNIKNVQELQRVIGLVSKERDSLKGQLEKAKKQVDQLKKSNDTLALQLKRAEQQKLEIGQKEKGSKMQNQQKNYQVQILSLFGGEAVSEYDQKKFLVNNLEGLKNSKIQKTKLLFCYPRMKGLNPHTILDGIGNYIILMNVKNQTQKDRNYLIALYSQRPLSKESGVNNGKGFIASLTNKQIFQLKKSGSSNPRVTQYNDYYFVFGNSEMRWKINNEVLETNIGHNFRSFDTGKHKDPQIFTGSKEHSAIIVDYEIFQVEFKD